ncbi:MAG TPA: phosphoribosylamine--glycine ligase, partial [Bryobacteraceae bacterium]|nr:phosphoribosylamine--glycine ligase [Bryobacteraceae bacterium]
ADENNIDLTIVGPEAPLVGGVVDQFRAAGRAIAGPTAAAARLEGSKVFSKDFMSRAGIPTARYETVSTPEDARRAIASFGTPVVLKADGLAAGKGVVVAQDRAAAEAALPALLSITGRLVVEEFLRGEEVSFIVLSDGRRAVPLEPTQDHKCLLDGDRGPNTGGMGAYSDSNILTGSQSEMIMDTIIEPTLAAMAARSDRYTGFLYAGLMMTTQGPKVLEYNARLGDPETQPLMYRLHCDWAEVLLAAANGNLAGVRLDWKPEPSVCVVVAADGYPGAVRTGDVIRGIREAEESGAIVFHAGTRQSDRGIETAGGRVLGVTASGTDLRAAIANAYSATAKIDFEGMQYRRDIGAKGLDRREASW